MSLQENNFPVILERFALSYPRQARFGYELMPLYEATVARETYKLAHLGANHLQLADFRREYGDEAKRTQDHIKSWVSLSVNRYTVESSVDRSELIGSVDIGQSSLLMREARMRNAYDKMMNSIEAAQVKDILDESKYGEHTTTPLTTNLWGNAASDPITQIEVARTKIKNSIGFYPNKCVISDTVWQALRYKKNLIDRVIIADNMYHNEDKLSYTWGNNVVLAYVPNTIYSLEDLSFGVTVRAPLGYAEMRDYFDERTTSDVTAIDERLGWAVANYEAGFLFKNVL